MNYLKIRFGDEFNRIGSQLEKSIQDIFRPRPVNPMFVCNDCGWIPQMDIYETDQEIFIWAELAGVDKKDLEVEVNHKAIRIHGLRRDIPKARDGAYRQAEIRFGRFERIIYLPSPVDTDVVSSTFSNGFLSVRMLKRDTKTSHNVPISDG